MGKTEDPSKYKTTNKAQYAVFPQTKLLAHGNPVLVAETLVDAIGLELVVVVQGLVELLLSELELLLQRTVRLVGAQLLLLLVVHLGGLHLGQARLLGIFGGGGSRGGRLLLGGSVRLLLLVLEDAALLQVGYGMWRVGRRVAEGGGASGVERGWGEWVGRLVGWGHPPTAA